MTTEATDRSALREKIELEIYRIGRRSWNGTTLSERVNKIMALIDSIAPAAQPLPTRSEATAKIRHGGGFDDLHAEEVADTMVASGLAREDEPEPRVGEVVTLRQRTPEEREFYMIAKYAELERRVRDLESKFSPPPDKAVVERGGS